MFKRENKRKQKKLLLKKECLKFQFKKQTKPLPNNAKNNAKCCYYHLYFPPSPAFQLCTFLCNYPSTSSKCCVSKETAYGASSTAALHRVELRTILKAHF